jgi:putative DNA primase/helicase
MNTLEAARDYIRRGMIVIPLQQREKKPLVEGWPQLRLQAPDLPRYFGNGTNIGVLLGDDHGTADADLDCLEAIAAAIELLPDTTMIFGRQSKPISHYLYRTDPAVRTKKYLDPLDRKKGLIELRGLKTDGTVGLQTMVPPSTHPSGEMVRFAAGFDKTPAHVDTAILEGAVARVAAAAALARYFPDEKGGRNMAFLALAGAAARAGWTLEQTQTFHKAMYRILWGHTADFEQCKAEVRATFDKHAAGSPVTARTSLTELIDRRVVDAAFQWLGWPTAQGITQPREAEHTSAPRQAEAADDWPAPEPLDALPEVQPFDPDLLPDVLQGPVEDLSRRMQLPLDLPAVGMLAALAGAVNRRVIIQPNRYDPTWTEVLNLWAMLIAAPGVGKSPLMHFCIAALLAIEQDYRQAFDSEQEEYAREHEEHKLQRQVWETQYKTAIKDGKTPPPRSGDLDDAPVMKRLITNDASYEKLHVVMKENPGGLLLAGDELSGWLSRLDQPEHGGERAFALSCWNGKTPHIVDRIGRGTVVVPHCCLSVLGAITPEKHRSYLAQTGPDSPTADGLVQRFGLSIWPDIPKDWVFPRSAPNAAALEKVTGLFRRLVNLDHSSPRVYQFAPDAQELFAEWQEELMREVRGGSLTYTVQSHLAKYPKLMSTLAALFELAKGTDREPLVSAAETARALDWCPYLRSHAERIYAAEASPSMRAAALLAKKIRERKADTAGVLEVRVIYRHHWEGLSDVELVKAACEVLVDAHWLREIDKPTGGRPAGRYQITPRVWK